MARFTLAALLLASMAEAASVSIQYEDGAFNVVGWQPGREPAAGWSSVFVVSTGADAQPADAQAMFGTYAIENGQLTFRPRYPLAPGVTYVATLHAGSIHVEARIAGPAKVAAATARVAAIYPSSPVLPDNQLKLYLVFSAPMQGGDDIFTRIHLVDSTGKAAYLPFVSQELWNRDYTRLTLIFDPGRIKRGVKPNVDLGPVLTEGRRYTLTVDRDLKDANGNPLAGAFHHDFAAGPAVRQGIDPARWRLSQPHSGTVEPLTVVFDRPLDYALLGDSLEVPGVQGKSTVGGGETQWSFRPDQPWKEGQYKLAISMALEDLAGNRIGRPFDVDEFISPAPRISKDTTSLDFQVRARGPGQPK